MKKGPFIILLTIELLLGLLGTGLLLSELGVFSYLIGAVVFGAVLTPFFFKLRKTEDAGKKAKIRCNILLVMLLPIAIALAVVIGVVAALRMYFG